MSPIHLHVGQKQHPNGASPNDRLEITQAQSISTAMYCPVCSTESILRHEEVHQPQGEWCLPSGHPFPFEAIHFQQRLSQSFASHHWAPCNQDEVAWEQKRKQLG